MSLARESELELKVELSREQLQRMRWHPALGDLAAGEPVTRTLRSIYFDTPDHRLRALGISLRLRSDGESWLQTVKAGTAVHNGVSNPIETEVAVEQPEPDLGRIGNRKVRRKVEKAVEKSILEPVFETVVKRTTRQLHSGDGELELALDEGTVRAGGAEDALCEAELELKSGAPECLLQTAAKLFARSRTPRREQQGRARLQFGAGPDQRTRARRAATRRAATTRPGSHLRRGVRPDRAVGVRPDRRQPARRAGDGGPGRCPPAAHRPQAAAQRAQRLPPLHDTAALRELEGHAQALARTVGELRDADVLIEHIYAPVAGMIRSDPGLPLLRDALFAHRTKVRERVRAALGGQQWSVLQLYLALWPRTIEGSEALAGPVRKFARSALKKRWKKVADSGERLDDLTVEQRHRMRKALKTLRYATEFFASLYPEESTRRFIKETRSLQEVFGYLNDVVAAERLGAICHDGCADSREAQRAAGYILGWHNAQAAHAWKDAHKGWLKLEGLPQFWG